MIEYDSNQSKEIYNALLDSKVELLEYFLGPDTKKTSTSVVIPFVLKHLTEVFAFEKLRL